MGNVGVQARRPYSRLPRGASLWERLKHHRRISGDCWIWTGALAGSRDSRGVIRVEGRSVYVHRLSLALSLGIPVSKVRQVNHKRECTTALCFNPEHLYQGSQKENVADSKAVGTFSRPPSSKRRTHCRRGHPLSQDNVYSRADGGRCCRRCVLDRMKARGSAHACL
ncbi:hypothetical protein LCGC14_1719420 [marine sediment metagenome]|uniref:HNH nuclease domain-containing protein n=1 Tax=marine sediment metagenome TaxID=412755 RepID=A0A0F9HCN9_9ZZZZ